MRNFLNSQQPVTTAEEAETYLVRLASVKDALAGSLESYKHGVEQGVVERSIDHRKTVRQQQAGHQGPALAQHQGLAGIDSQAVLAVPFDPHRLEMTGTAVPVTEQVDGSYCFDANASTIAPYSPSASLRILAGSARGPIGSLSGSSCLGSRADGVLPVVTSCRGVAPEILNSTR